jgi:aspartyl-tRNA(Asn)/glutamyl-tRNA(Gln) amidotransferase subunit A
MAKASDARRAKGEAGALEGAPLGIKDLFAPRRAHDRLPCPRRVQAAPMNRPSPRTLGEGAVMLGKLNMDEFAMGSSNETSRFGNVDQPLAPQGRQSAGARRLVGRLGGCRRRQPLPAATATDTGGSIRQPAAFTGTVGIKPTYGRCSRWGIVAFASSLDQAGPIAKTVATAAILLKSMASHDPKDTTSLTCPCRTTSSGSAQGREGLRVGIPKEYRDRRHAEEIDALWQQGIKWLKEAGAEIVDISLPHTKYALPAYYIVAPAEASSNLARYDGVRYGLRVEGNES